VLAAPRRTSRALGVLLFASILLSAGASQADPSLEEKAAARALATQGSDALKSGRFPEALDLVTRAEAIVHAPTHLLMIARAQTGMGKLVAAHETYLKIVREELAPTASAAFRNAQATAREELAAVEPRIASLRIDVEGAVQKRATVKLDDVTVPAALLGVHRPVDPGHHVVAVSSATGTAAQTPVDLREGEKRDIKLAVPDGPPPPGGAGNGVVGPTPDTGGPGSDQGASPGFLSPLRGAGIALLAVGVAGAAVGGAFLAKSLSAASNANNLQQMLCNPPSYTTCPSSKGTMTQFSQLTGYDSDAATGKAIAAVGLPVGGAALVAGVVLLVVGKPSPAASPRAFVAPWFGGTSGGLQGAF
jgi:hypothetical protein